MAEAIVCDTSVWLYLGRIGLADLLLDLYHPVCTTDMVCQELDIGRVARPDTFDPRLLGGIQIALVTQKELAALPPNQLGKGEQSVLAYASASTISIVALDDREARQIATQMGLGVIGTVGLLLKAKFAGLLPAVRPPLEQLHQAGFYMSEPLFTYALMKAGEEG